MKAKNVLVSITLLLVLSVTFVYAADDHANYYSLHDEAVNIGYIAADGTLQQEQRQGFLDLYNIEDSKIACNSELDCPAGSSTDIIPLPGINLGSPGVFPPSSKKKKFRVFIPEGTVDLKLTLSCVASQKQATVVKFNEVPDCAQCSLEFDKTVFTQEDSFPFETFEQKEVYLQNAGGHINIYTLALLPPDASGQNPPWPKGGWLYINNYFNSDAIAFIQFSMKVNKAAYLSWYQNYSASVGFDPDTNTFSAPQNDTLGLIPKSTTVAPTNPTPPSSPTTPTTPSQDFSVELITDPVTGAKPLTVTFTPNIINGTNPSNYHLIWDFGDNSALVNKQTADAVTHTYNSAGKYFAQLIVKDTTTGKQESVTEQITIFENLIAGNLTNTASQTPAADVSVYAIDIANTHVYTTATDNDGQYAFDSLADGQYILFFGKPSAGQFFLSNQSTQVYSLNESSQSVDYAFDAQTGSQTYGDGKTYCIENPDSCNIIVIENDLDIHLQAVSIPGSTDRYDIVLTSLLNKTGNLQWKLGPVGLSNPVTLTALTPSDFSVQSAAGPVQTDDPYSALNPAPTANNSDSQTGLAIDLDASLVKGFAPLAVTFTPTIPAGMNPTDLRYIWDFGDGNTSTENTPTVDHLYNTAETYFVGLNVKDTLSGDAGNAGITITVEEPNTITGTLTDTAVPSAASGISVFALDINNHEIYSTVVNDANNDGIQEYAFYDLPSGDYLLFFADTNIPRVYITQDTAKVYSVANKTVQNSTGKTVIQGDDQTVDFTFDSQSKDLDPALTYTDGKAFCMNQPEACGIIAVDATTFDVVLKNQTVPDKDGNPAKADITLKYMNDPSGTLKWELDLADPDAIMYNTPAQP